MFKPVQIENIVDNEYQDKIYQTVTNINFPWHFMEDTTTETGSPLSSTPAF